MEFRRATEADRTYLLGLNRRAYEDVVVRQFGSWDDAAQRHRFAEKWAEQQFRLLIIHGRRTGALWTETYDDYLWLRELQIEPVHQGVGLGTRVLQQVLAEGTGLRYVKLRVLKESRAQALYKRMGFSASDEPHQTHIWMHYWYSEKNGTTR